MIAISTSCKKLVSHSAIVTSCDALRRDVSSEVDLHPRANNFFESKSQDLFIEIQHSCLLLIRGKTLKILHTLFEIIGMYF